MASQRKRGKDPLKNTLYIFGAYGIGKERIYMAIAKKWDLKVMVDKTRWKNMLCYDWPLTELGRLTADNSNDTPLLVVGMNQVNFNHMANVKQERGVERVVGFSPTGWSFTRSSATQKTAPQDTSSSVVKKRTKGDDVIFSLPYSEHSSFEELVDFVRTFR